MSAKKDFKTRQFIDAIEKADWEVAGRLAQDEDVNLNANDNFALYTGIKHGQIDFVELLLERGADATAHDNFAIKLADLKHQPDIVDTLIGYGADISVFNEIKPIKKPRGFDF